jgi:uncharacterized membrane protein
MSNGQTKVHATDKDGGQLSVSHTTTDSPLLPAANLEQLQRIDPTLVSFVVEQTEKEAAHRRAETSKINTFVFIERVSGVVVGGLVAAFGLAVAAYVAINGHETAACIIGGTTLAAIVAVIVTRKLGGDHQSPPKNNRKSPSRKR